MMSGGVGERNNEAHSVNSTPKHRLRPGTLLLTQMLLPLTLILVLLTAIPTEPRPEGWLGPC